MIMINSNQEYKELFVRIEDNISASESGMLAASKFLSPAESFHAKKYLAAKGIRGVVFFGGFRGAERERLIILPAYLDSFEGEPLDLLREYFGSDMDELVRAIKITGSGYRELSHRDYLGSILSLGVEREALGDVIVINTRQAYVFAMDSVARLMLESLDRIGNDKVKLEAVSLDADFTYKREFIRVTDTVASARLDCVAAALANVSREKAQGLIDSGLCSLNYCEQTRCDKGVGEGDIITLRGYGKFIIRSIDQQTKKGRLRLIADKYA